MALSASLRMRLERLSVPAAGQRHSLYIPSGGVARYTSLGFRALMADMYYIWSIQYYSDERREERFKYLREFYDVITDLDPRFENAYVIGALILALEASDLEGAVALLEKGSRANPTIWYLPFEAGYYCYKDMKDYERSLSYFRQAAECPGAPDLVRSWYGFVLSRAGSPDEALAFWTSIFTTAKDEGVRRGALRRIHELQAEFDLRDINTWIASFRNARGRCPKTLDELIEAGVTQGRAVPLDPGGSPYRLDMRACVASRESTYMGDR